MLRGRWSRAVRRSAAPLGLFLLALAVRALPWRTVFDGDRVLLFGNDAYYHLRRIRYTVDRVEVFRVGVVDSSGSERKIRLVPTPEPHDMKYAIEKGKLSDRMG